MQIFVHAQIVADVDDMALPGVGHVLPVSYHTIRGRACLYFQFVVHEYGMLPSDVALCVVRL